MVAMIVNVSRRMNADCSGAAGHGCGWLVRPAL
jgi:hypothetical protein